MALERPAASFDRAAHATRERALHGRLVAEQVAAGFDTPIIVDLTDADRAAMVAQPSEGRLRVGVIKRLDVVVDFSDLPRGPIAAADRRRTVGAIRGRRNGGWVWTAVVQSPDARALRLHLENFHLPHGATLWVYNEAGRARGPYTGAGSSGTNELWTHTITGPTLVLQLEVPGHARAGRAPSFDIAAVGHLGAAFQPTTVRAPEAGSSSCSFNVTCVENASCATIPAAIEEARDAVALIEFVSGAFLYLCSGGLIADTDGTTQIPYFLTANHCLSRKQQANSVEAFFQFSTPCGGPCPDLDAVAPSTLGSDVVATDAGTDFTLLQLDQSPPSGSAFLGWTSTPSPSPTARRSSGSAILPVRHRPIPRTSSTRAGPPASSGPAATASTAVTSSGRPRGEAAARPSSTPPDRSWANSPGHAASTSTTPATS